MLAEVFAAFVGCVEAEEVVVSGGTQEVVDEGAPVTAETGGVAHNTLGIKSDDVFVFHLFLNFLNANLTSTKFMGTAIASTAIGASSRLRPIQRKEFNNTICRQ